MRTGGLVTTRERLVFSLPTTSSSTLRSHERGAQGLSVDLYMKQYRSWNSFSAQRVAK